MQSIGSILVGLDQILMKQKPDAVVIYGDTNSGLGALAVRRRNIPIFHFQAGNRCFSENVPEQINRRIIDHLSSINMTTSQNARLYLVSQGFKPQYVFKIGSPMFQVLTHYKRQISESRILNELGLNSKEYFLASIHRQQNVDTQIKLNQIIQTLQKLQQMYHIPIIVSVHPKLKSQLQSYKLASSKLIFHNPFGLFDYCNLQVNSKCVISDSGTLAQQSSILHFPAVTIRNNHQRPEANQSGVMLMSNVNSQSIIKNVEVAIKLNSTSTIVRDYHIDNWSDTAIKLIFSYINHFKGIR